MYWHRCDYCDETIHHDEDMKTTEDGMHYHKWCWEEVEHESRQEQFYKYAADQEWGTEI